jgi:hypothetical protein
MKHPLPTEVKDLDIEPVSVEMFQQGKLNAFRSSPL